jgi:hypothetical protein
MSYARFGWGGSDIYVFMSVNGWLECCGCPLLEWPASYQALSTDDMVRHLDEHTRAGHKVPADVIPALRADDAENFPAERSIP